MEQYLIISKKWLRQQIRILTQDHKKSEAGGDSIRAGIEYWQRESLREVLEKAKPISPIIDENLELTWKIVEKK